MKPLLSRRFVPFLVVSILAGVSLLAAEPALAAQALFRVQQGFLGAPFPPWSTDAQTIGTPYCLAPDNKADCGGAGRYVSRLTPYKPYTFTQTSMGATMATGTGEHCPKNQLASCGNGTALPPGVALVSKASNLPGQAFTLPRSFIDYAGSPPPYYPSTAFTGYLTKSYFKYVNGEARFRPNNPNAATKATTVTFHRNYPVISTTTMGKKVYTTTHGGNFGFSRNGYLKIDPGPNRFGGTLRALHSPDGLFYQYISYFNPLFFKAIGSFGCTKMGVDCTDGTMWEYELGEISSSGMATRWLLESKGIVDTMTPTKPNGAPKYTNTYLWSTVTKTLYETAKYTYKFYRAPFVYPKAGSMNYYLHLNAPFTTGKVSAFNDVGVTSMYGVHPVAKGYDKSIMGICPNGAAVGTQGTCTLTRTYTGIEYFGAGNYKYFTQKYYSTLKGITRVVSLVKPRLTHTYSIPRISTDPIFQIFQANRVANMKVFFLPEPSAMLLLGSGIAGLAGLAVLRRR